MKTRTILLFCATLLSCSEKFASANDSTPTSSTQIVLLGTGNPAPTPERSGPCTAIVVNGTPYLVDLGPGAVRQAMAAYKKGINGLHFSKLKTAFITHLHSDHTVGYPDFIFTPWVVGREGPIEVYGPKGTQKMTTHILEAWSDLFAVWPLESHGVNFDFSAGFDDDFNCSIHIPTPISTSLIEPFCCGRRRTDNPFFLASMVALWTR